MISVFIAHRESLDFSHYGHMLFPPYEIPKFAVELFLVCSFTAISYHIDKIKGTFNCF
jgi:hypothetical protein